MTFKNRINNALAALLPNNSVYAEYYKRGGGKKADWKRQANTLNAKEIKDWKNAVTAATDPDSPRRGDLMRFYQNLLLDNHLSSVIDTRILRVQRSTFKLVDDAGNENEDLKELLERPWFEELVRLVLMSRFQGTTLIEMFDVDVETMELERVDEIPQSNFIAQTGEVIKEEYLDDRGVSYKKGLLKDYYLQIGGDWDLGMLNQLAMIVLAKKLSLGSWMGYIDKFGVPPIFMVTDRMDSGRRDELFEMGSNFRQNMFVVLQGNEKIEVPNNYQVDAHNTFKALIDEICNKEISKRVLGGTALTDEKSFVGSSEVQERVTGDRYEADKLLFKFLFNSKIRQRLTKISPIYNDFERYQLVWDNQETLDIKGYIDAVEKLSAHFEFDIDEIRTRTGLPVTGIRQIANPFGSPTTEPDDNDDPNNNPNPQKKNPDGLKKSPFGGFRGPYAATWDAAIQKLAEQLYDGKIKPSDLDKDLVLKTYDRLSKSAAAGWGKGFYDEEIARKIRENLLQFSGAKVNRMLEQVAGLKTQDLSKEEYLQEAKKISERQNGQYLDTESAYTARSAGSAKDWQRFEKKKDIFPNLTFRTMRDSVVRPTHEALEGMTKPVEDPAWGKYTPPLDPGCRCWLEQSTSAVTPGTPNEETNPQYGGCVGRTGKPFTDEHSYFQLPKETRQAVRVNTEMMKEYLPYNRVIEAGEQKVFVNDFADLSDLKQNIVAAKKVAAELEKDIYIRPHIFVDGHKNPELGIGKPNVKGDLKTDLNNTTLDKFVANSLRSANSQRCRYVVLDITKSGDDFQADLRRRLAGGLNESINRSIKDVIVVRGEKMAHITRTQIDKRDFTNLDSL